MSAAERPLILIALHHALLSQPLCYVNDNQDVLSNGVNYIAGAFGFDWPDDKEAETPRARLQFSNVRGDLGVFFERTQGGRGATLHVLQIMRSAPDFVEDDLWLDLSNVEVATALVNAELSYDELLGKPGTPYTYRPETAPGLF